MRALVIDDEDEVRRLLGKMLSHLGYDVQEAVNGRDGLNTLRKNAPPDVVFVDWNMPEMDGLTFLKAVRSEQTYEKLRVMMVSGLSEIDQVSAALDAGTDEYLIKPFTQRTLKEKLAILGL